MNAAVADAALSARPAGASGWAEVEIPIETVDQAARDLLRLGPEAEVLAPPALRRAVADTIRQLAGLYDRPVEDQRGNR